VSKVAKMVWCVACQQYHRKATYRKLHPKKSKRKRVPKRKERIALRMSTIKEQLGRKPTFKDLKSIAREVGLPEKVIRRWERQTRVPISNYLRRLRNRIKRGTL